MRLIFLYCPLTACQFGLEPLLGSDGPGTPYGDDSQVDSAPGSGGDTGGGDTGGGSGAGLLDVTVVTPGYGTTAGGVDVTISGGPFDSSASVRFGSVAAFPVSVSGNEIVVTSPAQAAEGRVDISVTTDQASGVLESGFTYYADGTGKTGLIGSMDWFDTVGTYWGSATTDQGSASFFLSPPVDFEYWEFFSPSLDTCRSEYTYAGTLSSYEPGFTSATLTLPSGATLRMPWDDLGLQFAQSPLHRNHFVQGGSYDLQAMTPEGFPTFEVADVLTLPSAFTVSRPNLGGSVVPALTRSSLDLTWGGGGGDFMVAYLMMRNSSGGSPWSEIVTCAMRDDGSFTVPSATWSSWTRGRYVDVVVGRGRLPDGVLPFNHASSGFAGIYWVWGLGQMQ